MAYYPFSKPIKKASEVTFAGLPVSRFRPFSNHQNAETVCALTSPFKHNHHCSVAINDLMYGDSEGRSPHTVAISNVNFYR